MCETHSVQDRPSIITIRGPARALWAAGFVAGVVAPFVIVLGALAGEWLSVAFGVGQLLVAARLAWPRVRVTPSAIEVRNVLTQRFERSRVRRLVIESGVGRGPWNRNRTVLELDHADLVRCWALVSHRLDVTSYSEAELEAVTEQLRVAADLPPTERRHLRPTW